MDYQCKAKIIEPTPFGDVALIWSEMEGSPRIIQVLISKPDSSALDQLNMIYPDVKFHSEEAIERVADTIRRFFKGEDVTFSLDMVALERCSPFQEAVLYAEYHIPRGCVSTYRLLANHIGNPKGARAVGNALARNPFPIIIPCHRAVRSDGYIGCFQGGWGMKKTLLEKEGVKITDDGRVITEHFYYE